MSKIHKFVFSICTLPGILCSSVALADAYDPPVNYYSGATGTGTTLKSQLTSAMSSGHIQRSYGDFRYSAAITDADPNHSGNILLVYNRASVSGEWNLGGQLPWNREHVWPQSLQPGSASNGSKGNLGDPHALRPADTDINNQRGHRAFGYEDTTGSYRTIGSDYFYTGDADRGDIARQLFYSATRYSSSNLTFTEGVPSGNQMGDLSSLVAWHFLDPPDEFERRRNHAIYSSSLNPSYYTNNRNAFIDRPEFMWSVYVDQNNDSRITINGATVGGDGSTASTVDLGRMIVGGVSPANQSVSITKSGNDGTYYSVTTSGGATSTLSGSYNAFRTGGTDAVTFDVGLNTTTAGLNDGTITIDNLDVTTSGGAGRGDNDGNDVITVTADVLDHANASFADDTDSNFQFYSFGEFALGSVAEAYQFDIFNLAATAGFTADLDLDSILGSGDTGVLTTNLTPFSNASALEAGSGQPFTASIDTSSVGAFVTTYNLNFSDEDISGATNLANLTLILSGTVVESADFDLDDDQDGSDFLAWQRGFGNAVTHAQGDANGDGAANQADLSVWQAQFGISNGALQTVTIPEPSSAMLFILALAVGTHFLRFRTLSPEEVT